MIRVAAIQTDVVFNKPEDNFENLSSHVQSLAADGVHLAVFPECYLTGYCVDDAEQAEKISLQCEADDQHKVTQAHEVFSKLKELSKVSGIHIVVGFAGKDQQGLFNGAVLVEPKGLMRRYVKTHLPELGLDRFVRAGDSLPVFQTDIGRIGIFICFDLRPPEAARCLALDGAELLVLPTNWPAGTLLPSRLLAPTRASENKVFLVTCNRIGTENGWSFCGQSGIYGVSGEIIAKLDQDPGIVTAELELERARDKRNDTGAYATELFASRHPNLYNPITRS